MRTTDIRTPITDQTEPFQQVITLDRARRRYLAHTDSLDSPATGQRAAQRRAENLDGRMYEQRSSGDGKSVRGPLVLPERTSVTVIGDGAVGLLAVLAAKRLGAEQIILMGRHKDRTDLGREFGATDVVAERCEEGIEKVRELTGGDGTHTVLECVGHLPAYEQALGVVRAGGVISRVGVPQYDEGPIGWGMFGRNLTLTGGPAPVRAYIKELMPDILDSTVEPGRVFDRTIGLDETPDGYRAMDRRAALKVLVRP
jgi:threonine dehydrogenase-like Zn-dependent dehydrogenase